MEWIYNGEIFTSEMIGTNVGFVYQITNIKSGKSYIGQKVFYNTKYKTVKKKKKKIKVEMWSDYYGSNDDLLKDIEINGKENFKREILILCSSKSLMNYFESKLIFLNGCLESDKWYNNWISTRINKNNIIKHFNEL